MKNNKILLILSSIVLIYSLLGFVILPLILKSQIEKTINGMINYNASIYKIDFNPFLLKTKIHNFAIKDKTKEIITFKELYIDFSLLKSIHEKHISFKQVQLLDPVINIVQNSDGSINLL